MKERKKSLSPLLLGSTLFFRETFDDMSLTMKTLENYPIDTIFGSSQDFCSIDKNYPLICSHVQQMFSVDPIDNDEVKKRWMKLTNVSIDDDPENADDRIVCFHSMLFSNSSTKFLPST